MQVNAAFLFYTIVCVGGAGEPKQDAPMDLFGEDEAGLDEGCGASGTDSCAIFMVQTAAHFRKKMYSEAPSATSGTRKVEVSAGVVGALRGVVGTAAGRDNSTFSLLEGDPGRPTTCASPSLLHLELEVLRHGQSNWSTYQPCDLGADWLRYMMTTREVDLQQLFGRRVGHRHVTAAMYIVMAWAALSMVLILRTIDGLFVCRQESPKACKHKPAQSQEAEAWNHCALSWVLLTWVSRIVGMLTSRARWTEGLKEEELGPGDAEDSTLACYHRFKDMWLQEVAQTGLENASLKRVLVRFVGYKRIFAILCLVLVMQILQYVISICVIDVCFGYVEWMLTERGKNPGVRFQLAAPCAIMVCAYTVIPLSGMVLFLLVQLLDRRIDMRNEAALGMMIYAKGQELPVWLRATDVNESDSLTKRLDIVQLMVVDVKQNCSALATTISGICSLPVFAVVVVVTVWRYVGAAVVFGVLCCIPLGVICWGFGTWLQTRILQQQKIMDMRLAHLQEVFSHIRIVKSYGWESACERNITEVRNQELSITAFVSGVVGGVMAVAFLIPKLFMLGTLISHNWLYGDITEHTIFIALQVLKNFLNLLQGAQGSLMKCLILWPSLQRIENFLKLPDCPRILLPLEPVGTAKVALRLRGTFCWCEGGDPVLHDLDLTVQRGTLVAVVGEVGAGKSALLQAALGELWPSEGSTVQALGRMAYCAQVPWIGSGTVRENILGDRALDGRRYAQALAAAALQPDLEAWPMGDQAQAGSRGTALSGGQRVRLALARAAYDSAEIMIFDDPLAAVDTRTGKVLMQHLLESELMRERTRIVTMQPDIKRLAHFDEVVVLSQGRIVARGPPQEVMNCSLLQKFANVVPTLGALGTSQAAHVDGSHQQTAPANQEVEALTVDETIRWANMRSLYFLLSQGRARYILLCAVFQMAGGAMAFMGDLQFAHWANSKQWPAQNGSGHKRSDIAYIVASGTWTCLGALMSIGNVTCAITFAKNASQSIFSQVFRSLLRASVPVFYDRTPVGRIIARLSFDLSIIDRQLFGKLMIFFLEPFILVFFLVYVHVSMPWSFSAVALPFYGIFAWISSLYLRSVPPLAILQRSLLSKITTHLSEVEEMRVAVRAHGLMEHFQLRFAVTNDDQLKAHFMTDPVLGLWFRFHVSILFNLLMTLIALCCLFSPDKLKPGTFALCAVSIGNVSGGLPSFVESVVGLQFEFAGVRRLQEYTVLPSEATAGPPPEAAPPPDVYKVSVAMDMLDLAVGEHGTTALAGPRGELLLQSTQDGKGLEPPPGCKLADIVPDCEQLAHLPPHCHIVGVDGVSGSASSLVKELCKPANSHLLRIERAWLAGGARVRISDLRVRYPSSADVLRGVDITLEPAQRTGIVGRTGCGKTTLLLALMRIVEPRSGSVALNGVDTSALALSTLRKAIGLVPQEPVIFSGTVRQNLDPFGIVTEELLWHALRQLQAAECVEALPGGLEHSLNGVGSGLSMGQKQLLCLARMVPRQPGLLLLDEATSSIDPCTQKALLASIFSTFQHTTILAVAHKLETILSFDHCVVMDSGVIVEQGTLEDLRKAGGVFASMLASSSLC